MSEEPAASAVETINVGLADGDLRLCLAVEAARQGELRLAQHQSNLQAAEARATSALGWCATALSALAVVMVDKAHRIVAIPPGILLFIGALACVCALWPKQWHGAGFTPSDLVEWGVGSELEMRESLASGYDAASAINRRALRRMAALMALAWTCLATAPAVAAALVLRALG